MPAVGSMGDTDLGLRVVCPTLAQLVQDRAIRTIITSASVDQAGQDLNDGAMPLHPVRNGLPVRLGQRADFSTRALLVAPKSEQRIYLLDRKTECAGALDEAQLVDVGVVENPVTLRRPSSGTKQSSNLVVADQLRRNARKASGLCNAHVGEFPPASA